ncbi:Histone H2A.Z-specific chaperone [Acarospora aff. strigata]|nr:Histone H2A.Z-specific chaperone [Acarospora aff. strigata]
MSDSNGITTTITDGNTHPADTAIASKGKGKAIDAAPQDMSMDENEDEDSSDEETGAEDDAPDPVEEDEDDLGEIDPDNIIGGGRTRGKTIDFAQAAENAGDDLDEDEDDDEDFEEKDEDAMQE